MLIGSSGPGWLPDAGEAEIVLWIWLLAVLVYGLWRSLAHPDPDALRPSGPVE